MPSRSASSPYDGLVVGQPTLLDLVADDRAKHVHPTVHIAEHRARPRRDDRALRRLERIARVMIDGTVLKSQRNAPSSPITGNASPERMRSR